MDDEVPVIFEGKPGLCWYCGRGAGRVSDVECQQWKATCPVAVSSCRSFLPGEIR